MFKAAIRVNKITSIAQLRGATLHAERADETSKARLREGAEPGAALAWSKAPQSDRDYLAAHKAHKAELGAGERKGAPLCMQALCVISPEWVKAAGDLHDPDNLNRPGFTGDQLVRVTRPYRVCSCLHRRPPLPLRVGYFR